MQDKLQELLTTLTSAQAVAHEPILINAPALNEARKSILNAVAVVSSYQRSTIGVSQQIERRDEDEKSDPIAFQIREAEKHIEIMPDGKQKLGDIIYKGDVPQRPLLAYYKLKIAPKAGKAAEEKTAIDIVTVTDEETINVVPDAVEIIDRDETLKPETIAVPTTDVLDPISVTSEADYLEKKDLLANASEGFRQGETYAQIAAAVAAYEAVTGANQPKQPTRREVMETLLPALVITDAKIVEINEYAKNVSIDSIKKKFSKDEINAVNIVLHGVNEVDSALGAARTLHNFHHPEKA